LKEVDVIMEHTQEKEREEECTELEKMRQAVCLAAILKAHTHELQEGNTKNYMR